MTILAKKNLLMYNNQHMKVLLLQDNKNLGKKGDIVNVSDGFAFNNLIPRGIAKAATEHVLIQSAKNKKHMEQEMLKKQDQLYKEAEKLNKKKVTIVAQAKDGKLFGSVTKKDIADAIVDEYKMDISETMIMLTAPIKKVTTQEVTIDYGNGVSAGVIVIVKEK